MNGNQGGLDLFGEQLPQGERAGSNEPSPEDFLFSQAPTDGVVDAATVLTTTTTPSFGMPLGRYSMPEPATATAQKPAPMPPSPQLRDGAARRQVPGAPESGEGGAVQAPKPAVRRATMPVRRVEPAPARRERPMLQSLLLVGVVLTTTLGFASWIATEFGEYVLGGLAAVMGLVGSAFTWVLSRN